MKTSNKTNPPSAARLIDSLRHLDYTNEGAIYDIVDKKSSFLAVFLLTIV